MKLKRKALLAAMALICNTTASADPPPSIVCEKVAGMIGGPIVPTQDVAKDIYLAVAKGRGAPIKPGNTVWVEDEGDHWTVFQYSGPNMWGGGTLEMTIDKCNGSILAHYSR